MVKACTGKSSENKNTDKNHRQLNILALYIYNRTWRMIKTLKEHYPKRSKLRKTITPKDRNAERILLERPKLRKSVVVLPSKRDSLTCYLLYVWVFGILNVLNVLYRNLTLSKLKFSQTGWSKLWFPESKTFVSLTNLLLAFIIFKLSDIDRFL